MAPIFDPEEALASPYPPVGPIGSLALEFAALGHVDLARDLIAVLNREYPMHGLEMGLRQLQLAWETSGKWPEGSPKFDSDEEREEFEQELDAELWPDELDEDECTADEAGLERLLKLADAAEGQGEDDDDELDAQIELTKSICLAKALDISIKLAEGKAGKAPLDKLDDRSQDILRRVAERMHCNNQTEAVASSAQIWPYLAKGVLTDATGAKSEKLESLGKTINETIIEWFSRGPRAWSQSEKSLKSLLEICSNRSKEFWQDEFDEPAPETLFASSGASDQEIEELEKKLDAKLPADYKEFLGLSNGFQQVIADGIFEDFEAPLHSTSEISWRKADELIKNVEDDDDEDDLDDVDEPGAGRPLEGAGKEGRPAKKIKLADGAEASTKEAGDDENGDEIAGLEWLGEQSNIFNIELLPLPSAAHLGLLEENEGEWPEIEKVLEVGGDEGSYLWLLPPDQVRKARDAYVNTLDSTEDDQLKKVIRWAMVAFVGSEEAFRKLDDWAFVAFSNGQMHTWTNFRRYVEELADTCQKLEKVEDEEKAAKEETLAYSCR